MVNKQFESVFDAFVHNYKTSMGDWDTDIYGDSNTYREVVFFWIIWFLNTILNLIVMLNLLIAIISTTYERVTEKAK